MKVVILAGGFGTRISEESALKPKPMIEIGGKPILWHIMKSYAQSGFNEFVILLGYKGYLVKEYFANYYLHQCDITVEMAKNSLEIHNNTSEDWKVTLVDTGLDTYTGGRIKRAQKYIGEEPFMLTYGDGVCDVDLKKLVAFHQSHNKILTLTSIQPEGRFGSIEFSDQDRVSQFMEKPKGDGAWINGGFFVCNPPIFDYITEGDKSIFERTPLEKLSQEGELFAYRHRGFWQCMDTLRDKEKLCDLWDAKEAPWKNWN